MLWICFGEFAEGVDHVGWDGQAVLEVGNSDAVHPFRGEAGDVQTLGVVKDVGIGRLLQRVHRGNQKPHFIDNLLLYE